MVMKLKILNNKEQQRTVNTAQFIKILMINEENHRWPIDQDADEWSACKQREPQSSLLLTLPAHRAKHCILWGGEVSAGESRRVKEKKKGVTVGGVPVVTKVNQDANTAAAMHSLQLE